MSNATQSVGANAEDDELTLPRASINKMIKELVPSVRIANEARELILNCCTEFIHLLSSEANDICNQNNKKTINAEHILQALERLGFADYQTEAEAVLKDCKAVAAKRRRQSTRLENLGIPEEELLRQQQELFAKAREEQAWQEHQQWQQLQAAAAAQQVQMMKHVQLSPYRNRADTVSLSSNASFASLSPEPFTTTTSRSSSYTSLNEQQHNQQQQQQYNNNNNKTTIKVYARCLRPDIEYKTLSISYETTCREVVDTLLSKYRMKHRDPRLFYLSMEVMVLRNKGALPAHGPLKAHMHIALDDAAKPAVLQSCHPRNDSRFSLQTRRGGLVKVYDSHLNTHSQYKSLLISAQTTTNELITLLLTCSNTTTTILNNEQVQQLSLYEVWPAREQQRKLHADDKPLLVQQTWPSATACHFLIKRNPDYRPLTRRKFPLTSKPQCELKHIHLTEQQQQHYNNNNNSSIKNLALFKEKQKREQQERKHEREHEHEHEHEEQTKNYNSKYNDLNQSYANYENYFYI